MYALRPRPTLRRPSGLLWRRNPTRVRPGNSVTRVHKAALRIPGLRIAKGIPDARNESRTRTALLLEAIALRHQIAVLERSRTRRPYFRRIDRLFWILLSRWWPSWRESLMIVQPETVLRWRRNGWLAFWRYRSSGRWRGGRQRMSSELRNLIREMARENFLWGAPRIHGELLMLGYTVSPATVSRYLPAPGRRQTQSWRSFLRNQASAFSQFSEARSWGRRGPACSVLPGQATLHDCAGCGGRCWARARPWTPTVRRERPKNQSALRPVRASHYAPSASVRRGIWWSPTSAWQSSADRSCGARPTV